MGIVQIGVFKTTQMLKKLFFKPAAPSIRLLQQQLNDANRVNRRLVQSLRELVKANEDWNEATLRVIGAPVGWSDGYLDRARIALAAHAKYLYKYQAGKFNQGEHSR